MEFVALKKSSNRKRKRNVKNKRRVRRRLEVKGTTRRKTYGYNTRNTSAMRDEAHFYTMDAHSFWENYRLAQDWQQRHSVAWWKSRCYALEYENNILRQKVRGQASQRGAEQTTSRVPWHREPPAAEPESKQDESEDEDDESFEFQVDQDMLDFLEQSIRHKMELKRSRELEEKAAAADASEDAPFVTCEARVLAKTEDARLLYGDASPRIMAMEAALQATMDRHKDRANPHYWPNIPLRP